MDLFSLNKEDEDDTLLVELFSAYRDARKNKRNKRTQVAFEVDYERKLMRLHKSIVGRRTKRNFYALIEQINSEFEKNASSDIYLHQARSSVNSYLGTLIHFSTYRLRKKILSRLDASFYHYFMVDKNLSKVLLKRYY